ncbi:MAG TPA: cardiolipin synthase [Kofleriaceae bacterium]|nr:cardiolipin synthase [Kofleriaceae bacterium]
MDWPVVTLLATAWALVMAVVIVLERRSAAATIAWLVVLAFLPIVGLIAYRLIGPLRLERKKLRRLSGRKVVDDALQAIAQIEATSPEDLQLAQVSVGAGEAPPLRAERVEVYLDGVSAYRAIGEAIEETRHHLHLEYYIWEPDGIGTRLRDQLAARARAGVEVRMVVDGTGCNHLGRPFLRPLRDAGVDIAWFNRVSLRRLRRRRADFRTHRKIVVCDGVVGFTGGMNITDAHSAEFTGAYWRDTHLRVEGAAVASMQRVFMEDWYFATETLPELSPRYFPPPSPGGAHVVQIVASGPDTDRFAIHKLLFTSITEARERVWATTPYFVPDEPILTAMITAALRGVDVRLLVPRKGDSRLVDLAARSYFPELVDAGVRIFEYEPRFIHAKTMVVDDDVAIIGTANLDNRSFRLNFEIAAVLYGEPEAGLLARAFEDDSRGSRELLAADLEGAPFLRRLGQAGARLLSPLL